MKGGRKEAALKTHQLSTLQKLSSLMKTLSWKLSPEEWDQEWTVRGGSIPLSCPQCQKLFRWSLTNSERMGRRVRSDNPFVFWWLVYNQTLHFQGKINNHIPTASCHPSSPALTQILTQLDHTLLTHAKFYHEAPIKLRWNRKNNQIIFIKTPCTVTPCSSSYPMLESHSLKVLLNNTVNIRGSLEEWASTNQDRYLLMQ